MPEYTISKTFHRPSTAKPSEKAVQLCRMFGLTGERLAEREFVHSCRVRINAGNIVYITGPSGAGKSVLLRELQTCIPEPDGINLDNIELPGNKDVIDCVDGDLLTGLRMLSTAGLNDVFCLLNQPGRLSDGQKYRFRLAVAIAMKKKFVFADEFCSNLDRLSAAVISYNVHEFAMRTSTTFILASSHEDILLDLQPDVLIVKELSGPTRVIYKRLVDCV